MIHKMCMAYHMTLLTAVNWNKRGFPSQMDQSYTHEMFYLTMAQTAYTV
jgi:hypothetical protein